MPGRLCTQSSGVLLVLTAFCLPAVDLFAQDLGYADLSILLGRTGDARNLGFVHLYDGISVGGMTFEELGLIWVDPLDKIHPIEPVSTGPPGSSPVLLTSVSRHTNRATAVNIGLRNVRFYME